MLHRGLRVKSLRYQWWDRHAFEVNQEEISKWHSSKLERSSDVESTEDRKRHSSALGSWCGSCEGEFELMSTWRGNQTRIDSWVTTSELGAKRTWTQVQCGGEVEVKSRRFDQRNEGILAWRSPHSVVCVAFVWKVAWHGVGCFGLTKIIRNVRIRAQCARTCLNAYVVIWESWL